VARFLSLWRMNTAAPFPADPSKVLEMNQKMFAAMDALIKQGKIKEFGFFPDATSGYVISEGESTDAFRSAMMFLPYILGEIHEIIPYEKGKEILFALLKAQCAPPKK
jgi:hypothetical protein